LRDKVFENKISNVIFGPENLSCPEVKRHFASDQKCLEEKDAPYQEFNGHSLLSRNDQQATLPLDKFK
jgi:hypothetical protein